ncbi:DUF5330 domain-containing protein [Roseibium sp. AS2]|uniref:DUF5330 domain-containing protein n=1 Tax=Roseibium sp. AS2 TaxID=3135781 RepID=UPI00317F708E
MFFLLRTAFWLTLVLALIPFGSEQKTTPTENVDPVSAFLAAQATVSDLGGFCSRNPLACETGGNALTVIGSRARDGARIVYEYLDTKIADNSGDDPVVTGSTGNAVAGWMEQARPGDAAGPRELENVSTVETDLGPVPRSKPRSGLRT